MTVVPELVALTKAIGHASQVQNYNHLAKVILGTLHLNDAVFGECCCQLTKELHNLCSVNTNSILRKKSKEELLTFTWDAVYDEFQQKCPRFLQFLHSATANPSALTNKVKDSAQIRAAMCSAGCKLVSIFSDDMSALRYINSVMAKKGGLKKVSFVRLCATYDTMSYTTTSRILESLGENHDNMVCQ